MKNPFSCTGVIASRPDHEGLSADYADFYFYRENTSSCPGVISVPALIMWVYRENMSDEISVHRDRYRYRDRYRSRGPNPPGIRVRRPLSKVIGFVRRSPRRRGSPDGQSKQVDISLLTLPKLKPHSYLKGSKTMEELFELRNHIQQGRYADALALLGEMEEMSRDDKINKIESLLEILLLHLIKRHAEQRSTRSWDVSISGSVHQINRTNKRRKAGGYYLNREEIRDAIDDSYPMALKRAALEAFEGTLGEAELADKVDEAKVKQEALSLVMEAHGC